MKVYVISTHFSTDEVDDAEVEVFGEYGKAVNRFKELIENEKKPEASWVSDAFEGGILQKNYDLCCSSDSTEGEERELWWEVSFDFDRNFHSSIELKIFEVA